MSQLMSSVSMFALGHTPPHAYKNPNGVIHFAEKKVILIEPAPLQLILAYMKRKWNVRVAAGMTKEEANDILFPWQREARESLEVAGA